MIDPYEFLWDQLFEEESEKDTYYEEEKAREKYYEEKYNDSIIPNR